MFQLKNWLFSYFNFERSYDILKSKSPCILLKKYINFYENETGLKMENPLCWSSCKNRKLEIKLWWVGACERKRRAFFVPVILSEGSFFKICVLSQCIVYWIHFQNINTFRYQKTLLLVSKIVESLQCILNHIYGIYTKSRLNS